MIRLGRHLRYYSDESVLSSGSSTINCRPIRFDGDSPSVCFSPKDSQDPFSWSSSWRRRRSRSWGCSAPIHKLIFFHGTTSFRCVPRRIRLSHYFPLHCAITETTRRASREQTLSSSSSSSASFSARRRDETKCVKWNRRKRWDDYTSGVGVRTDRRRRKNIVKEFDFQNFFAHRHMCLHISHVHMKTG